MNETATRSPVAGEIFEYAHGLWRRRWIVLAIAVLGMVAAGVSALRTPSVFQSQATILIEQQEIPQDFVRSTITSFADQRIQVITQRVMTSQNLQQIIERNNLYAKERESEPREVVIQRMREAVRLRMISADVIDPRSGSAVRATLAFSLSYRNSNPELAYKVTSEITSLYLNENLSARSRQTQQALSFLEEEGDRLLEQLGVIEKRIAEFKRNNQGQLPQSGMVNYAGLERAEAEIRDLDTRLALLDHQDQLLRVQLAQMDPVAPVFSDSGQRILGPEERLKALKSTLAALEARYGPGHPDVTGARRQIAALESRAVADGDQNDLIRRLDDARTRLAQAQARYTAEHPDVRMLSSVVSGLEQALKESPQAREVVVANPDNPAYMQVKAQLESIGLARRQAEDDQKFLRQRLRDLEQRVAQAPEVERLLVNLTRDYDTAFSKYQNVRARQLEAQASLNLETDRKGERFTLIEPPVPSQAPVSPQRGMILGLGVFVSVLFGLAVGALLTFLDSRIRGAGDLTKVLEVPPLARLPVIVTAEDLVRMRRRLQVSLAGASVALVTAAIVLHVAWRPLDLVWLQILRRLGS